MPPPEEEGYIVTAIWVSTLTILTLYFVYIFIPSDIGIIILPSILSAVGFYFILSTSVLASVSLSFICAAVGYLLFTLGRVDVISRQYPYRAALNRLETEFRPVRTQLNALRVQQAVMQSSLNAVSAERNALGRTRNVLQTQRNALGTALEAARRRARPRNPQNGNSTS